MSIAEEGTHSNQEQLRSTVDRLHCEVHEAARQLADAGHAAAKKLRDEFGLLRDRTLGVAEQAREKGIHVRQTLDERVRVEPVKSLIVAAAVGTVFGLWLARRR